MQASSRTADISSVPVRSTRRSRVALYFFYVRRDTWRSSTNSFHRFGSRCSSDTGVHSGNRSAFRSGQAVSKLRPTSARSSKIYAQHFMRLIGSEGALPDAGRLSLLLWLHHMPRAIPRPQYGAPLRPLHRPKLSSGNGPARPFVSRGPRRRQSA